MSRIGSNPIKIEEGVNIEVNGQELNFSGPKGTLFLTLPRSIAIKIEDNSEIVVSKKEDTKEADALWGTSRSLIANCVEGVSKGFQKKLEISGVGFRVKLVGENLEMSLGLNHPIVIEPPEGISFDVPDEVTIIVNGFDKQLVGQVAAKIREYHKTEPYKGKGIKYEGEYVRRKSVKKAAV
jgi:large subunit ribosomal protein L6